METYQINEICRCCLKNNGQMRPLYGFSLDEMLQSLVGEQVKPNDGFPELICFQCVLQLSRAFRFKIQCQRSNEIILEYIKKAVSEKSLNKKTVEPDNENGIQSESLCEENENTISVFESDDIENTPKEREALKSMKKSLESTIIPEFKCTYCIKEFKTKKQLVRHMKIHEANKPHKCFQCNKMFSQSCNLKKHTLKHSGALKNTTFEPHLCQFCGKIFKYNTSLSKHMKFHTGKNLLHCPTCAKFFFEKATLQNHLRCHTGDRPFVCHHCNASFTSSSNLNKHLRSHSDKRPYKCDICGQSFVQRNYLTTHSKVHDPKHKALCSKCGKCFTNAKSLYAHMRIHNDRRLHICGFENCDKTFSRLDSALIHRRIHTGEKPYSCETCTKSFKTSDQLLKHSRKHDTEKKSSQQKNIMLQSNNQDCYLTVDDTVHVHREVTREQSPILFEINENGALVSDAQNSFLE